jgi:hypothetical protein
MISYEMPDEIRSVTVAAMCGMRTDTADFGVAVEGYTFAAHRDQFAAGSHTIVGAHFACPAAKEDWEHEGCERDHLE